jgi:hypothetical protein
MTLLQTLPIVLHACPRDIYDEVLKGTVEYATE